MTEETKWSEISEDELMYRTLIKEEVYDKLPKDAIKICNEALDEVMRKLGVNTDSDKDSISFQMQLMDIYANYVEDPPSCAGIYVSILDHSKIRPFAYIKSPEVDAMGVYIYKPSYFNTIVDDFPTPQKVRIG